MKTGIGKTLGVLAVAGFLTLVLACSGGASEPTIAPDTPTVPPTPVSPTVSIAASQGGGSQSIDLLSGQSLLLGLNLTAFECARRGAKRLPGDPGHIQKR